jgi:phage recombination protein Bet
MSNLPAVSSSKFSNSEIDLLRTTYAKGLSDTETTLFLKQAEAMNLNPFTKEIYAMVIKERLVLITSISGLRKIAHQTGSYIGCQVSVKMDGDKIVSSEAIVRKLVSGHIAEFRAEVMFKEYNTGKNNWATMPITMIKKVAESHALRMAYPAAEHLYEESEVGAMKKAPKDSPRAQELTEKFVKVEPREVTPHPDHHEDMPLTITQPVETPDMGHYVIGVGKNTGKMVKDISKKELEDFVAWAYSQEKLSEKTQEYLSAAEAFLG